MSNIIKSSHVIELQKDYNIKPKEDINSIKEKVIDEANKEYERIIQEARKKADEMINNAQIEYDNSIQNAYDKSSKIIAEYRKEGYDEGYEIGKNEADKLIEDAIKIKEKNHKQKDNLLKEIENDVITLVIDICEKVIGKVLDDDRETILSIITKGIHSLNAKENLIIRVYPDDYDLVEMSKQKILAMGNLIEDIQIKPDNTLDVGGCIIETCKGSVDTSVRTQLDEINILLKDLLNRE